VKQPQVAQTKSVDITYHIYTLPRIFSILLELLSCNPGALSFPPGGGNVNAKSVQEPFQYMLKHSRPKLLLWLNVRLSGQLDKEETSCCAERLGHSIWKILSRGFPRTVPRNIANPQRLLHRAPLTKMQSLQCIASHHSSLHESLYIFQSLNIRRDVLRDVTRVEKRTQTPRSLVKLVGLSQTQTGL
jgi:hypothetical protein